MVNDELYHYGVKGMKWGIRKKRDYVTVFQAQRNASAAANKARKESIADSRANGPKGIGSYQKANRKALNAKRKAYGESMTKDRAHNQRLRAEKKQKKIYDKYNKKLKSGSLLAIVGLAYEDLGYRKLADLAYSRSDKVYEKWERKANEALAKLNDYKISEL